jgi:hypothetical protein
MASLSGRCNFIKRRLVAQWFISQVLAPRSGANMK